MSDQRTSLEETVTTPGRTSADGESHRIIVLFGPSAGDGGKTVLLRDAPVGFGRDVVSGPHLVLDDPEASRAHATIARDASSGKWQLTDLGSKNGTFVNAARVQGAMLSDGDVIRIGSHLLLFQFLDAQAWASLADCAPRHPALIGQSHRMLHVQAEIRTAAVESGPVLVLGESGTGKELVARAIHEESGRKGPLVALNCAALPDTLAESELFGHAPGAFTGATARAGLFGEANAGTLFLDEIGSMPLGLQAKLLRALSTGEVRRVGEDRAVRKDVRVVAATNDDLERAVHEGTFRGDLYARLAGRVIELPALRERRDDIMRLTDHFLAAMGYRGRPTTDFAEALLVYAWPFNVRELEHTIKRAAAARSQSLELDALPETIRRPVQARRKREAGAPAELPDAVLRIRRDAMPSAADLQELLRVYRGNVSQLAGFFGKDRRQIYRWAERLGLDLDALRKGQGDGDEDG